MTLFSPTHVKIPVTPDVNVICAACGSKTSNGVPGATATPPVVRDAVPGAMPRPRDAGCPISDSVAVPGIIPIPMDAATPARVSVPVAGVHTMPGVTAAATPVRVSVALAGDIPRPTDAAGPVKFKEPVPGVRTTELLFGWNALVWNPRDCTLLPLAG